jgi:hypothetical protein
VTGPIFLAGSCRSGKTLLRAVVAESPNITVTRRTDMWPRYYERYGDLARPANFERCVCAMLQRKQIAALGIDIDALRRDFTSGDATYARLFDLMNRQATERAGKQRWLDQTASIDVFADQVFAAYPDARIVHMIREPRDAYVAVRERNGDRRWAITRFVRAWIDAASGAARNARRFPHAYTIVRYESLVTETEATVRHVCDAIEEPFVPSMLTLPNSPRYTAGRPPGEPAISDRFVGVHLQQLDPRSARYIASVAGTHMKAMGYDTPAAGNALSFRLHATLTDWPVTVLRTIRRDRVAR